MSQFNLDALIQFSELSKAFAWSIAEMKSHSESICSLLKFQKAAELTFVSQDRKLTEVQSMVSQFNQGMVSIQKIEDKLASWSERFRTIEEGLFSSNYKISELENFFKQKMSKFKRKPDQIEKNVMVKVEKCIENRVFAKIEVVQMQLSQLNEVFFQFKEEMEKIEESSEFVNKSEEKEESLSEIKLKAMSESVKVALKDDSVKQAVTKDLALVENSYTNPDSPRKLVRTNTMVGVNSRISTLENQIFNLSEEIKLKDSQKNTLLKILENKNLADVKEDIDKLLEKTLNEIKLYKIYFDNLNLEVNNGKFNIEDELEKQVVAENEKRREKSENFEEKWEKTEEKCRNLISEHQAEIKNLIQPIENALLSLQDSSKSSDLTEKFKEILDTQHKYILKLEDKLEKLQKVTMMHLNRSEIGDILVQFAKKLKDPSKERSEQEDYGPKIFEQEQKLNKLSRSHNNSLEILESFEKKLSTIEKILIQLQENKSINVEFKISTLESSLSDQIKQVKESFKFFENVPELIPLENERYFRSMLLELRADINQAKEEIEKLKSLQSEASIPMSSISIEEIQEPIHIGMLQSILKQHENAIRLLANKIIPTSSPEQVFIKEPDKEVELNYLEELKREMKEMIQKKEENQRLSKQDLELIQKISETAEGKIGREELGLKAEKEDLKRIYSLLKKRIDILADALKRSQAVHKDEPFFTKKSLKLECASCGKINSPELEKKITENFNRMHNKSPTSGIAFSKILSSLIPNSRGGLRLPIKTDRQLEPLSSPKSQKRFYTKNK